MESRVKETSKFQKWLCDKGMSARTANNYCSCVKRTEREAQEIGLLDSALSTLTISQLEIKISELIESEYLAEKNVNTHNVYKTALNKYFQYRVDTTLSNPCSSVCEKKYSEFPTLLVGLGGIGSKTVKKVNNYINGNDVEVFCIDSDVNDLFENASTTNTHALDLSCKTSVADALTYITGAREWFPRNTILLSKTIASGAGQVRAVSRLLYEISLLKGSFNPLIEVALKLANKAVTYNCGLRINIVTSLFGGTGAGIFLQIAMLLRKRIALVYPNLNVKIQGEFVMPGLVNLSHSAAEICNMEALAYASLKELNAINSFVYDNGNPVELVYDKEQKEKIIDCIPYDYCFIYDAFGTTNGFSEIDKVANKIYERLFGLSSNLLNEAFISQLRTCKRKKSVNLYGIVDCEKIDSESIYDSRICSQAFNYSDDSDDRIIAICSKSPITAMDLNSTTSIHVVADINNSYEGITVLEVLFAKRIDSFEKLRSKGGKYYASYKQLVDEHGYRITPHLNVNWHVQMADIDGGVTEQSFENSIALNEEKLSFSENEVMRLPFVFISYSSKEIEIANQTKLVLENNGIPCWMAPQSIPAGSDYAAEIPSAITDCCAVVLLLSKASQESNWVPKEVGIAIGKGKMVIPFKIDDAIINDTFNFYLTNNQRIEAYNRMTDAYKELVKRLKSVISK